MPRSQAAEELTPRRRADDDAPPPRPAPYLPAADGAGRGSAVRAPRPPVAPKSPLRFVVTLVLLGAAVNVLLPQVASLRGSLEVLRSMRPGWLGLAALAQLLRYGAQGLTTVWIVRVARQRLSLPVATAVNVSAWTVGLVAGGIVGFAGATYAWLRDFGIRMESAVLAGWVPPLMNAAVVALAALVGSAELLAWGKLSLPESIALGSALGVLVVVFAALAWAAGRPRPAIRAAAGFQLRVARLRRRPAPRRPGSAVQRLLRALRALGRRGGWKLPLLASVLVVAFDMLALHFAFVAARSPVGFGVLLAGYGLPTLLSKVAVIPGGVGVVEGTMIAIFAALGVPAPTAVLVVLAYRVLSFWVPNLLGFPLIPVLQARASAARAAAAAGS